MSGPFARLAVRGRDPRDEGWLDPAVDHLRGGGLIAYPTETVYGFGGSVKDSAVGALTRLKRRGPGQSLLLLIEDPTTVSELEWPPVARELAGLFWPGPLTLVLADPQSRFPQGVRSRSGGVAVRQAGHPIARALVAALGGPLTSTSANAPGQPPARSAAEAVAAAAACGAPPDLLVIDGGPLVPSAPSTLVDCTGSRPVLLREGAVPLSRLRCALPELERAQS